jgi:hypothetical protein
MDIYTRSHWHTIVIVTLRAIFNKFADKTAPFDWTGKHDKVFM